MTSHRIQMIIDGDDRLSRVLNRIGDNSDRLARRLLKAGAVGGAAPFGAAIIAGAGGLVAAFASAGLAAGAFGAAVQPQLKLMTDNAAAAKKLADAQETMARKKQVAADLEAKGSDLAEKAQKAYTTSRLAAVDAEKAYDRQTKGLPKATSEAALSLAKLKLAHEKWSASLAGDTMPVFTRGLDMARQALPLLTPLVKTAGGALSGFMDGLDGHGLKGFLDRINDAAKRTLPDLLNTGKNVFVGLGGIIDAFLPTSAKISGGIADGAKAFADWGTGLKNTAGFQKFMELASAGGGALGNLATAAVDLVVALSPLMGATTTIAEGFAKFIGWLPPETLAAIATGMLAIKVATLGWAAAQWVLNAATNASGIGLIIKGVALLGLAFYTAWTKSQTFREVVTSAFAGAASGVLEGAKFIIKGVQWIVDKVLAAAEWITKGIAAAFGWVPGLGGKLKSASKAVEGFRDDTHKFFDSGISKLSDWQGALDKMPKAVKLKGDINDLQDKIASAKQRLKTVPDSRKAEVRADIGKLQGALRRAKAELAGLHDKTVHVTTVRQVINKEGATARSNKNLAGYASGGRPKRGEVAWVGEHGPELMSFTGSERIFDHGTSMSMISPSADAGRFVAQGLNAGMGGSTSSVAAAARRMAAAVTIGIKDELQIASPSKKTKALAKDVGKGFIAGLTGSRDKIKSVAADLAKDIRTAFSGHKESSLLKMVGKDTKKLEDAAKKRDAIAAKIAAAKGFAADVTKNAREGAGLSNLGMEPEQVTAGGIKAGLASKLAQIKQFTKYVDILAKKGLNKNLLRQILNMGPEQGYAYASALVGADKGTFKQINSLQGQLDKSTTTLGKLGADRLYDSGKNAGRGFLKGLEGQQKDIENLMVKIAKAMQKAIKKALGIKSPSTVMAKLGAYSTQGLARGLVDGMPVLDQALAVVSGRVAGTQPVLGRPAIAGADGGGVIYNVNVTVEQAMDPVAVGRELQRIFVQFGRAQGATVRLNLGG